MRETDVLSILNYRIFTLYLKIKINTYKYITRRVKCQQFGANKKIGYLKNYHYEHVVRCLQKNDFVLDKYNSESYNDKKQGSSLRAERERRSDPKPDVDNATVGSYMLFIWGISVLGYPLFIFGIPYRYSSKKVTVLSMEKKNSNFSLALVWFGAAISIAEILTGTAIAPLGFTKGLIAIVLGHLIGCALMYFSGLIGAKRELGAMQTISISFGKHGSSFFALLNVLQLIGWTAVMIDSGASAAAAVSGVDMRWLWCAVIAALIIAWLIVGSRGLNVINSIAMSALFILTLILSVRIFASEQVVEVTEGSMSFGAALELSIAMPLSWLPLVSDYTKSSRSPKTSSLVSSAVYFCGSCWMYIIGMAAAVFTGEYDVAAIMSKSGLGVFALVIVIFSTVTTTYLDVFSAGVSANAVFSKLKEKPMAVLVTIFGLIIAIVTSASSFEAFLYLISSVFVPMIAILIADFFILKNDHSEKKLSIRNIVIWAFGFALYRIFLRIDTPIGNTVPVIAVVIVATVLADKLFSKRK